MKNTLDDVAVDVLDGLIGGAEDLVAVGTALVLVAAKRGFVVSITEVPQQPLAMGNYGHNVNVRSRRKLAHE